MFLCLLLLISLVNLTPVSRELTPSDLVARGNNRYGNHATLRPLFARWERILAGKRGHSLEIDRSIRMNMLFESGNLLK
jgi:hypothetical protein